MKRMRELAGIDSVRPTLGESFSAPSVPFYAHYAHTTGSYVDDMWVYAYEMNKVGSFKCIVVKWPLGKTGRTSPKPAVKTPIDFRGGGEWTSGWKVINEQDLPPEVAFRFKPALSDLKKAQASKDAEALSTPTEKNMDYVVVGGSAGKQSFRLKKSDFVKKMTALGFTYTGDNASASQRPELQGQPKFKELLGPMWGGTQGVRYETQAAYDQLSMSAEPVSNMKRLRELAGVDSVRPGLDGLTEVKTPQVPALHGMTPLGLPMAKPDKAPKKLKGKALDKEIEKSYYKLGHGVQIDIMDISKVFKMGQASYEKDGDIEAGLAAAIKQFRKN